MAVSVSGQGQGQAWLRRDVAVTAVLARRAREVRRLGTALMDPSIPGDPHKLREAIRCSQNELEPFRQQYRDRPVPDAGDVYGDNWDAADSPFNVYNLALRIYKRRLFSGQMRVLCARLTTTDHTNYTNGMF